MLNEALGHLGGVLESEGFRFKGVFGVAERLHEAECAEVLVVLPAECPFGSGECFLVRFAQVDVTGCGNVLSEAQVSAVFGGDLLIDVAQAFEVFGAGDLYLGDHALSCGKPDAGLAERECHEYGGVRQLVRLGDYGDASDDTLIIDLAGSAAFSGDLIQGPASDSFFVGKGDFVELALEAENFLSPGRLHNLPVLLEQPLVSFVRR